MTKTEYILSIILVWLVIFTAAIAINKCSSHQTDIANESTDPIWIVIADDKCWITFDRPNSGHNETSWTSREGGEMRIVGNVYYLKVVDGNMSRAYFQLGVSEEQCLNL